MLELLFALQGCVTVTMCDASLQACRHAAEPDSWATQYVFSSSELPLLPMCTNTISCTPIGQLHSNAHIHTRTDFLIGSKPSTSVVR